MKNKVFSVWLRELASLIFVQSMQAILIMMVYMILVTFYSKINSDDYGKRAAGILCIIVLTMLPKLELLSKKIFGLGSGVMDDSMMGGKKSLLKTGLALRGGMRVLNNGARFLGGAAGLIGSFSSKSPAMRRVQIAQNNLDAANTEKSKLTDNKVNTFNRLNSDKSSGDLGSSSGRSLGDFTTHDLAKAIRSAGEDSPQDALDKAKHDLMQERLKSVHKMASGAAETAGAFAGATSGAIIGLATGDDVIQNSFAGMGIGDAIGEGAANLTVGSAVKANENLYTKKKVEKKYKESEDKLKSAKENASKQELEKVIKEAQNRKDNRRNYSIDRKQNLNTSNKVENVNNINNSNKYSYNDGKSVRNMASLRDRTTNAQNNLNKSTQKVMNDLKNGVYNQKNSVDYLANNKKMNDTNKTVMKSVNSRPISNVKKDSVKARMNNDRKVGTKDFSSKISAYKLENSYNSSEQKTNIEKPNQDILE